MFLMSLSILFDLGDYGIDRNNIGGVGLRAVELAETLSESFNVRVLAPGSTDPIYSGSAVVEANATRWAALLADADVVMFFDMPDGGRLEQAVRARRIIVSENAPPIEQLEYPRFRGHSRPVEHHQGL